MLTLSFIGSDAKVIAWLRSRGSILTAALLVEMQRQMIGLRNYVVASKLSGQALHTKTGTLRRSQFSDVTQDGSIIRGVVATDPSASKYGKVHEFGGTFTVRAHLRKTRNGHRMLKSHSVTYPERSFLRSSLQERAESIVAGLQAAANKALQE